MLSALATIAGLTNSASRWGVLRQYAQAIAEVGHRTIESPYDRAPFDPRLAHLHDALATK